MSTNRKSIPFDIQHGVLARLGKEHIAHASHRRGADGDHIVAWGDRILEWAWSKPQLKEVVPAGGGLGYSNGGCALDVDGDGAEEVVIARGQGRWASDPHLLWFKEVPGRQTWIEHEAAGLEPARDAPHDIQPLSMKLASGQNIKGVAAVISRRELVWFEIPKDPREPWKRHEIGVFPVRQQQSGMVIGDIAGHGRPDIVCGSFWAECPADPTRQPWVLRRYGDWDDGGWGGMRKLALADMDGDDELEIVASEAEIPNARLSVFERDPAHPEGLWRCHEIERGLYCPHSLVLADLSGDGRMDIIVGEMTAGGWDFPLNPNPRIMAYENRGRFKFERSILSEGFGVHEMEILPHRPDGQIRIFAADEIQPQKFPEMETHLHYWTIAPASNKGRKSDARPKRIHPD